MENQERESYSQNGRISFQQRGSSSQRGRYSSLQTFNEILGDFELDQLYMCFFIALSGVIIAWQMSIYLFISSPINYECIVKFIDPCDPECAQIIFPDNQKNSNIVMDWALLCGNKIQGGMTQGILTLGKMSGCLLFGHLADQLGRRPCFLSAFIITFVMGIIAGITPWFWLYCFAKFFLGLGCGGSVICCLVFLVEYVDVNHRELMVIIFRIPYALGFSTMPLIAYFVPEWRKLQLITSGLCVVFVGYFWLLQESPRWLLVMGYTEKCVKILQKSSSNKNIPPDHLRMIIQKAHFELKTATLSNGTMVGLFKTHNMCKRTCILCFAWFCIHFKFYGIIEYMARLATSDIYLTIGTCGSLSIVGNFLAYFVLKHVSRRKALLISFVICAACLFTVPLFSDNGYPFLIGILAAVLFTIGTIVYTNIQLISTELFPTILRNSGIGLCVCVGSSASILTPFAFRVSYDEYWVPSIVYGILCTISAMIILLLPETKGQILPDTIEEGENFGKKVKVKKAKSSVENTTEA